MSDEIQLRPAEEIQAAHDRLVAIILGEVPNPFSRALIFRAGDGEVPEEEMPAALIAAADVLCWVLQHDHNRTFEKNLAALDEFFRANGLELRDTGRLQRRL